jgi:hypothetical protein
MVPDYITARVRVKAPAVLLGLFAVLAILASLTIPAPAKAAGSSYLNFQARLLTPSGGIVPDGSYNIDFKIYNADSTTGSVGSCSGACLWEETRTVAGGHGVQVINGYFSVNLGSVTAFPAINWSQELWLTMNLTTNGTQASAPASGDWDGEMQNGGHSVQLTAIPYSFVSGQLAKTDGSGNKGILGFNTVANAPSIVLPDASGTVCLQTASTCGFESTTGTDFIQNSAGGPQTANFNIQSAASGSIAAAISGASGQSVDIFQVKANGVSDPLFKIGSNGQVVFEASSSATAFRIQSASAADTLFTADSSANKIIIGNSTGTDTSTTLLTLDNATADPATGFAGAMYFNTSTGKFRCYSTFWDNCGVSGTFLHKDSVDTSGADAGSGYLYTFTNSGTAGSGGVLSLDNGSNTGIVLNVKGTGTSALVVQNSSAQQVFGVDTSNKQVVLGQSSAVNGSLLFKNSSNTNGITLNTTGGSGAYSLTLPTAAPAGGLCIETSPGNASQLVFASCSNNNASIQEVAYWDANNVNTVSVSPTTAGDEMVLTTQIPTGGVTVTGIAGGGVPVGGWNKVIANSGNGTVNRVEMWVGTVATTGSSTITITYSASPGSNEITTTEFTAAGVNASTSWGIESSGAQLNSTASTTVTYPNMTAVSGSELYVGYAQVQNPPASNGVGCNTTNFSYQLTSTQHNMIAYNTSLTANTAYQPIACQNTSGQSNTVAGVLTAFVTSSSINNTTSLQKANFYVQAATSGTVAGVLQAASSGSADIMDLRNSGGSNVLSVSSTGDVLVKPAASATAFQVQNNSGYAVMSVDTSGSQVVLGDATHLSGKITFKDSTDSNTISILAPSSVAASYQLALPTNTPTAGLCLGTSPSNANQLIFASCATQVSAASITYINQWSNSGTNVTTVPVSPSSIGNLMVLFTHTANNVSIPGGGVSGGGVTNWTKVTSNVGAAGIGNDEMWRGVVTTTGSSTVTISSFSAAGADEITAQEYTMGGTGGGTWAIDTSGTLTGTSETINYPSLTPANSSELYAGYAWSANTPTPSGTSGYTYTATNSGKYTARNTSVTGGVATQPQSTQTSANFNSIAAVIQAFAGTSVIVNSTATQQANFNVQAPLSGTVAGVLQGAASGSADVLQVKDGSGNNIMTVNGASGVTLGTSTILGGQLVFNASGNSNTITILAPSTPGTSYQLKLPSAQAAPGQCLSASPSDNTQLVFSSCANQVTSVAINFVNNWKTSGNNVTTLSVSPANLNDLMVFFSSPRNGVSTTNVTGCGITWSKISGSTAGSGADTSAIDMYKGVVTTTGACTLTATFSGSEGNPNELAAMEFSTGSTTGSWVVDASNTQFNGSSTTSMTFPSLTPQSSRDLYVGYGSGGTYSSGCYTGFTCIAGSLTGRVGLYNTNVSGASQPVVTTGSSASMTVGALVAAYSSSSVISNSTVTQQANFNIQASTSTSVAGVLQAFPGSSADILQIMDSAGAVVDSFGGYGNLLIKPSTASAAAFQVQNTSSVNVLSVDTSLKQVVVGAGSTGEATPSLLVLDNETGTSADPTGVNGAMYYNATTHNFRCYAAGAWQNCGGLLYSNTSQSSANNNCSNNCSPFSTFASIPANFCQAGRVIRLNAHGYFSSTGTTSLQFGVYYDTTLIGTLTPSVSVTSAANNYFGLEFDVTCFSTTSMQADGLASVQIGSAAAGVTGLPVSSTSPTTVVSTSTKNLYITPVWGVANSLNTAKITQFVVNSP